MKKLTKKQRKLLKGPNQMVRISHELGFTMDKKKGLIYGGSAHPIIRPELHGIGE